MMLYTVIVAEINSPPIRMCYVASLQNKESARLQKYLTEAIIAELDRGLSMLLGGNCFQQPHCPTDGLRGESLRQSTVATYDLGGPYILPWRVQGDPYLGGQGTVQHLAHYTAVKEWLKVV